MSESKSLAREIARAIKEEPKGKTSPFDTTATVNRIEGGTAWVQIPGGVDETPVQLTVNAKEGDAVQIRVAGGKAWITGNGTNPPTDDTRANEANETAIYAQTIAENAEGSARRASLAAEVAEAKAQSASDAADEAWHKADDAEIAAGQAQTSAQTANSAANGALTSLSTVQDVIGMLNWAQENASYSLTQDTDIVPGKTYWTRSGAGTEADPYVYTPVVNPVKTDLNIYYEIAGVEEAMGDFINAHLALTDEGLWILPDGMDTASYRVLIATGGQGHTYEDAGTYIIDSAGKTVAKLGEAITLGIDDESHLDMDYHSMQLVDKEGETYFFASDLRDDNGVHLVTERYTGDGSNISFLITFEAYSITSVTVDGVSKDYSHNRNIIRIEPAPADKADIEISYVSKDRRLKAYTLGLRKNNSVIGGMSVAEGYDTTASGIYSHAEGYDTTSSGRYAHAEGVSSEANGEASHAEGISASASGGNSHAEGAYTEASGGNSHAEGEHTDATGASSHAEGKRSNAGGEAAHAEGKRSNASGEASHAEGYETIASGEASHAEGKSTEASNDCAHAEGKFTEASGFYSHAQNIGTVAAKESQTAIGSYNIEDTETDESKQKALIIGNGTNNNYRSNALTVDWQGNVWTAGTVTENNGTRDIDLNISEATIQKYVNLGMSLT